MKTPTAEARIYDGATKLVETAETELPRSTIGMQARKRALREGRVTPARVAREAAAAKAETEAVEERVAKQTADQEAHDAAKAEADAAFEGGAPTPEPEPEPEPEPDAAAADELLG